MARPIKKGLDYHSMDVDFLHDIKIRKAIRRGGPTPVLTYICLLGLIYKNGYFIGVDSDLTFIISELTGVNEEETIKNIELLLDVDLISRAIFEKSNVYTSSGIQSRYKEICINSKRKVVISELMAVNPEETPINSGFSTQSKVKESKENKSKVNNPIQFPKIGEIEIELTEYEANTAKEINQRLTGQKLTDKNIDDFFIAFCKINLDGTKFYENRKEIIKHFHNWVKTQKIHGNNQSGTSANGTKTGTSDARIARAKTW
jgi:hypothetical protein